MFCFSNCTALHVSTNIKEIEGISYYRYDLFIKGKAGVSGEEKFHVWTSEIYACSHKSVIINKQCN